MKRKLTKKRALELCRDLWEWLAKQDKAQYDAPLSMKHSHPTINTEQMAGSCPLCQFTSDANAGQVSCAICPLLKTWKAPEKSRTPCYAPNSPYNKWAYSTGISASKYATQIADAAKKELAKLRK